MSFKNDPGFGQLFRNKYKEKSNQPDHKGAGCCPFCEKEFDVSAWIKEGANGKFFSLGMQKPYKKEVVDVPPPNPEDFDEDIPF